MEWDNLPIELRPFYNDREFVRALAIQDQLLAETNRTFSEELYLQALSLFINAYEEQYAEALDQGREWSATDESV